MADRKPALGKGLSALIPESADVLVTPPRAFDVDVDRLEPNDCQPRAQRDAETLDDLAQSIRAHGVIQPIVVRALDGWRYQIIAGERRWRAAQRAGLVKVPVVVRDLDDSRQRRLEIALIENLQRENLNPIEEAEAYHRLVHEFGLRHEDVARQVGRDRSSVANTLRLLKLPEEVRAEVAAGRLSMGHARAIVSLESDADQRRVGREVLARGLSVRETEAFVKKAAAPAKTTAPDAASRKDVHTRAAEDELRRALGTSVSIKRRRNGGILEISFANEDELQRLYEYLTDSRR